MTAILFLNVYTNNTKNIKPPSNWGFHDFTTNRQTPSCFIKVEKKYVNKRLYYWLQLNKFLINNVLVNSIQINSIICQLVWCWKILCTKCSVILFVFSCPTNRLLYSFTWKGSSTTRSLLKKVYFLLKYKFVKFHSSYHSTRIRLYY